MCSETINDWSIFRYFITHTWINLKPAITHNQQIRASSAKSDSLSAKEADSAKLGNDDSFRAPLGLPQALGLGARPRVRPRAKGGSWVTRWVHWVQKAPECLNYYYSEFTDWVVVSRPTRPKTGHFGDDLLALWEAILMCTQKLT